MTIFYEVVRRLLCALLGVGLVIWGTTSILAHLHLAPHPELALAGASVLSQPDASPLQVLGMGLAWILVGAALLALSLAGLVKRQRSFDLQEHYASSPGIGRVRVTEEGLKRMLARAGTEVEGISGLAPTLSLGPQGWDIDCAVFVWNHTSIPRLTDALRRQIIHAMEEHTGLTIHRLDLNIMHHSPQEHSALR